MLSAAAVESAQLKLMVRNSFVGAASRQGAPMFAMPRGLILGLGARGGKQFWCGQEDSNLHSG